MALSLSLLVRRARAVGSCSQLSCGLRTLSGSASSALPSALHHPPRGADLRIGSRCGRVPPYQCTGTRTAIRAPTGVPPVPSRAFSRPISAAESLTDLYGLLGVAKEASTEDIQRAFHRLAKKYHPDRNPGDKDIAAKFAQISRAYELLSQPHTRQFYDLFVDVTAIGDRSRILHWQSLQAGTVVAPKAEFATSRMSGSTRLMEASAPARGSEVAAGPTEADKAHQSQGQS